MERKALDEQKGSASPAQPWYEAMLGESLSLEAPIPKPATEAQVLATPW